MRTRTLLAVGGIAGAVGALVAVKLRTEGDPKQAMAHRMREHAPHRGGRTTGHDSLAFGHDSDCRPRRLALASRTDLGV